ncbi:hypothetical protein [Ruegeria atlantica]|uniref:hypothetical protein n=1 Tax=Ruegeria atlantica TaxID=81569 RepID=UPI00147C0799|nr:hypothetical protein [Ruegeria atlantica]
MTEATNTQRDLCFADAYMSAILVENVDNYIADGIVVNLSTDIIYVEGEVDTPIQPWRSATLRGNAVRKADRIAVLKIENLEQLGGVMLRGWDWFGDIYNGFPRETPLFMSSIDSVGFVTEDPFVFTRERTDVRKPQQFEIKLKCWWSPNETDCFIHNEHPFLEVHTQIHGYGRMQKFRERDAATVYEDVIMAPGFTHEPFCIVTGENEWTYPWHRYYTDLESIWLAIELHPVD